MCVLPYRGLTSRERLEADFKITIAGPTVEWVIQHVLDNGSLNDAKIINEILSELRIKHGDEQADQICKGWYKATKRHLLDNFELVQTLALHIFKNSPRPLKSNLHCMDRWGRPPTKYQHGIFASTPEELKNQIALLG